MVSLEYTFVDVLAKQVRMGDGYYPVMNYKKPPFDLPIVFEDDHFAIGKYIASVFLVLFW